MCGLARYSARRSVSSFRYEPAIPRRGAPGAGGAVSGSTRNIGVAKTANQIAATSTAIRTSKPSAVDTPARPPSPDRKATYTPSSRMIPPM